MNKSVIIIAFMAIFMPALITSCNDVEEVNMQHIEAMRDSIFKTFPTVAGITIRVAESEHLHITIGDAHLYTAGGAAQKRVADQMGEMALRIFGNKVPHQKETGFLADLKHRIFGDGNTLQDGKLTITRNEHTEEEYPADGISFDINLDSLRKSKP